MLDEKPRKVVAVALANRMARIIWAVTVKAELQGTGSDEGPFCRSASQMSGANERWLDPKPRGGKRGDPGLDGSIRPNGRERRSQLESAGRTRIKVGGAVGRTSIAARAVSPHARFGSDLTNTIRARGRSAGSRGRRYQYLTRVTNLCSSGLPTRGASRYGRYARGQLAARGAVAKLRYGA